MPEWWPLTVRQMEWLGITGGVMFFVTLIGIPWLITKMRADYFIRESPPQSWWGRHPAIRFVGHIGKNLLGIVLVAIGIVLSIPMVPGQGLLTILLGVLLLDFPRKRQFELWFVRRKTVLNSINWIRQKAHKPPLQLPDENTAA